MSKGFGIVPPKKNKVADVITTLSAEETEMVLAEMYDFLECDDHLSVLGRMAIRRYAGEGRGAIVSAPWQHPDPDLIPTHYMVESELKAVGLAYPSVLYDLRKYKPHSEFLFIYWKQEQPKTLSSCQVIALGVPLIQLFKLSQLGGQRG